MNKYYDDLESILNKCQLKEKPHLIYNLDETGLQPEHRPSSVIASKSNKPQAITSPRSTTVTLIACANAAGTALPPYYVFKGKRTNSELLKGALPGTGIALTETGWSNKTVFKTYLQDHFLKYAQAGINVDDHILLIYDGRACHVSLDVIEWAKEKIILFVLPPHTSHMLQPLDVGCFGPFKSAYYSECSLWMARQRGEVITKYIMCEIACKAYSKTMTPANILASFRKTGISPFKSDVVPLDKFIPAESFPLKSKKPVLKQQTEEVADFLQKKNG